MCAALVQNWNLSQARFQATWHGPRRELGCVLQLRLDKKPMCSQTFFQIEKFSNTAPVRTRMSKNGAVGWEVMQISMRAAASTPCCFFASGPAPKLAPQKSFKRGSCWAGPASLRAWAVSLALLAYLRRDQLAWGVA